MECYFDAEFIDDYRLLISRRSEVDAPPSLVLMDTGKFVEGIPVQTFFFLYPHFTYSELPYPLLLERGVYKPSLAESLAPFHPDPYQRIVALRLPSAPHYLVFQVGALLEFLQSHEGTVVQWDEWRSHVVIPSINLDRRQNVRVWVSGCRFFSLYFTDSSLDFQMEVYDFSVRGRVKYLSKQVDERFPGVTCLSSTGVVAQVQLDGVLDVYNGHDSIVFHGVSVMVLFCSPWEGN
jgi:hypothetical protein